MKWVKCEIKEKWIPINESFMDGLKSMWKKVKDAFKDLPLSRLVGKDNKKEVRGYVHDYNKSKKTCSLYVKEAYSENASIAAAVAASNAMSHSSRGGDDSYEKRPFSKMSMQQFNKGDKATLIGSNIGENIPVTVAGYEKCADLGIYELQLEQ